MPGTFSQIYIQVVFAVKGRQSFIQPAWEEELYKYITGILTKKGQKMLAINGAFDHIHFLIGMKPSCCLSDLVREIKKSTNTFVNTQTKLPYHFDWQEGYGAFSYSHSALSDIIGYIQKQKEHHKRYSFRDEYIAFLRKFEIDYQEKFVFDWIEE